MKSNRISNAFSAEQLPAQNIAFPHTCLHQVLRALKSRILRQRRKKWIINHYNQLDILVKIFSAMASKRAVSWPDSLAEPSLSHQPTNQSLRKRSIDCSNTTVYGVKKTKPVQQFSDMTCEASTYMQLGRRGSQRRKEKITLYQ